MDVVRVDPNSSSMEVVRTDPATEDRAVEEPPHAVSPAQASQHEAPVPRYILPVIVGAQFAGTSLWFATNSITGELNLRDEDIGWSTSAVQFGFIFGTLVVALTSIADVFHPSALFAAACITGATLNALLAYFHTFPQLIALRVLTGMTLAGIYPIGLKISSDWYGPKQIGRALGWLVGALVAGTALPFVLRIIPQPFQALLWETSALAAVGGLAMLLLIPSGPNRKPGNNLGDPRSVIRLFCSNARFRSAAVGYFGHMWELYAFYTWCPIVWRAYIEGREIGLDWDENSVTFYIIAFGSIGCVLGGYVSQRFGSAVVAYWSLAISGTLCLFSPLIYSCPPVLMFLFYLLWGATVVADSPQFSSLVAQAAPPEIKGSALTAVTCLGFAVTIGSIQLLGAPVFSERYLFLLLAPGPAIALMEKGLQTLLDRRRRSHMDRKAISTRNTIQTEVVQEKMEQKAPGV